MPEPGVEPDSEAVEQRVRLFRSVKRLPAAQRRVIFGRFVEQKSILEIAQQLGRTEGAVKQLQLRALQTLRRQMEGAHA
jgi:RNA polymerase sigma-70 factor (ECF subfamily)